MPYRKGDQWVAQVREGNHRIQKVFNSKKPAVDWEAEQRKIPSENWQTRSGSLGGMANEYLEYSRVKHSQKTFEEKRALFRRFFQAVDPSCSINVLGPDLVMVYLSRQAEKRSGHSANKDRKNLLAFSNWLLRYKGNGIPAIQRSEKYPEIKHGRYIPPEEDFWKVYEVTQGQDRTMLLAYLHLGARRGELFRLTWDDVDFDRRQIRLFTRKRMDGSMEGDWLPMTDELCQALEAHRLFVGGDLVFPGPGGREYRYRIHTLERWCSKANVRKFGWHAIRHLTGTILAQLGVSMIIISQILRHKNLRTTELYLKRMGDLRGALELLSKNRKEILSA